MKKQLCVLFNISLICTLYAEPEAPTLPASKTLFESNKFNDAIVSIQYKNLDGTIGTRTLTPADSPIFMASDTKAAYFNQNKLQWFSREMAIGTLIGVGCGFLLFGAASWFLNRMQKPKKSA